MPDAQEPSSPPRTGRRRRLWAAVAVLGCLLAGLAAAARHEPAYYHERLSAGADAAAARRLVTKVASLQAAISRPGSWDAALDESEINAWLATDLPANHARLLPAGIHDPRLRLSAGRVDLAVRVGPAFTPAVLHLALQIHLRGENQLAIGIDEAGLGLIPLPRAAIAAELGRRLGRLGATTSLRRLDGGSELVVYIPPAAAAGGTIRRLGSFAVVEGSLLVAGETHAGGMPR